MSSPSSYNAALAAIGGIAEHDFPCALPTLLFPSNFCLLQPSQAFLEGKQQFLALALLYQSKRMLREALVIWMQLATGHLHDTQQPRSSNGGSLLPGVRETVSLLSTMSDSPLLWEFAEWYQHSAQHV